MENEIVPKKIHLPKPHSEILTAFQEGNLDELPYSQRLIDSVLARLTNMGVVGSRRNFSAVNVEWEVVKHG